jgi:AcrR family transcriptional regulator
LNETGTGGATRRRRASAETRGTVPSPARRLPGRPATPGLRAAILRAAGLAFSRREFHQVLVDDVARDCGVSKGTVYRYFQGKRELYLAVIFEEMESLTEELERVRHGQDPPAAKVEELIRCILGYFWDRRQFFALLHRAEQHPDDPATKEWLVRRAELVAVVERTLEEARAAGHVRPVDNHMAAELLLGMLRAANRYRREDDRLEALVAAVSDVFLEGVGTAAGQRLRLGGSRA